MHEDKVMGASKSRPGYEVGIQLDHPASHGFCVVVETASASRLSSRPMPVFPLFGQSGRAVSLGDAAGVLTRFMGAWEIQL